MLVFGGVPYETAFRGIGELNDVEKFVMHIFILEAQHGCTFNWSSFEWNKPGES